MSNKLTITFPTITPTPVNGYQVKYWSMNNTSNITTLVVFSSPVVITGLTEYAYGGTIKPLCRGTYTSNTLSIPPSNPICKLSVVISNVYNADNSNGDNGGATVTVSGGSGHYNIVWTSSGSDTFSVTDLVAGKNQFVVTDTDTDCTYCGHVTIINTFECPLQLSTSVVAPDNAEGTNGTATVHVIGALVGTVITYLWSNNQTTATATGLTYGQIYTCEVTWDDTANSGNICVQSITTDIIPDTTYTCNLSATFTHTDSDIYSPTGTATISVSGGVSPYSYLWSNGDTIATATFLDKETTYICTVVDLGSHLVECSESFTVDIGTLPEVRVRNVTNDSLIVNYVRDIPGFKLHTHLYTGESYVGTHAFTGGAANRTIIVDTSGVTILADAVSVYLNDMSGSPQIDQQHLVEGNNTLVVNMSSTDILILSFENIN